MCSGVANANGAPLHLDNPADFMITENWYIFFQAPIDVDPRGLVNYLIGAGGQVNTPGRAPVAKLAPAETFAPPSPCPLLRQAKMAKFRTDLPGKWHLVPRNGSGDVVTIETPSQVSSCR